jgi:hypothetical protein
MDKQGRKFFLLLKKAASFVFAKKRPQVFDGDRDGELRTKWAMPS